MYYPLFEKKVIDLNLHNDINNYLNGKSEVDYRNICNKLVTSHDNTINIPIVSAFVIAVPWMIYAKYTNNMIDN